MMPTNAAASAWQYAAMIIVVVCSAIALLCHLLPSVASRLRTAGGNALLHHRLPASIRKIGNRLKATAQSASCNQGCGPCAGCGTPPPPFGVTAATTSPESRPATIRRLPSIVQEPYCGESGKARILAGPECRESIDSD